MYLNFSQELIGLKKSFIETTTSSDRRALYQKGDEKMGDGPISNRHNNIREWRLKIGPSSIFRLLSEIVRTDRNDKNQHESKIADARSQSS